MVKVLSAAFFGLALVAPVPSHAQTSCEPYCDYLHDYGPRDLTYVHPGLFCYPRCFPNGTCAPYGYCTVSGARTGRVTVRSFASPVATTPTTATYYDPSLATVRPVPRRVRRARQ
jgi:hypothetical protein